MSSRDDNMTSTSETTTTLPGGWANPDRDLHDKLARRKYHSARRRRDAVIGYIVRRRLIRHGVQKKYVRNIVCRSITSVVIQVLAEQVPSTVEKMLDKQRRDAETSYDEIARDVNDGVRRHRIMLKKQRQGGRKRRRKFTDEEEAAAHRLWQEAVSFGDETQKTLMTKILGMINRQK